MIEDAAVRVIGAHIAQLGPAGDLAAAYRTRRCGRRAARVLHAGPRQHPRAPRAPPGARARAAHGARLGALRPRPVARGRVLVRRRRAGRGRAPRRHHGVRLPPLGALPRPLAARGGRGRGPRRRAGGHLLRRLRRATRRRSAAPRSRRASASRASSRGAARGGCAACSACAPARCRASSAGARVARRGRRARSRCTSTWRSTSRPAERWRGDGPWPPGTPAALWAHADRAPRGLVAAAHDRGDALSATGAGA